MFFAVVPAAAAAMAVNDFYCSENVFQFVFLSFFVPGGDYDYTTERAYPGLAIYHQGMDLIAVVSTGDDVWRLRCEK